ncbi:serine hydrolase domain-containing protein [Candidatus Protochlamydia sp. W-9]|uniref:serine hydrolase domain-containing protein n=1 Tax=Candidatus Protochlamydia sp. W-9 TaxID=1785087 RepID=UPI00096AB883|nr:serine hydrolase domain-containing protein [Candidatus Protochlamydia sp. W-9]
MELFACHQINIQKEIDKRVQYGYNSAIVVVEMIDDKTKYYIASPRDSHLSKKELETSIFEIGSLTKLFTAHLTFLLAKEGYFSVDEPVEMYLPLAVNIPSYQDVKITMRHLLTHTSGLIEPWGENYLSIQGNTTPAADYTIDDLYRYLNQSELKQKPGTKIQYSNLGYGLIGHILENITGKNYYELLKEKILSPLQMNRTFQDVPADLIESMVEGTSNGRPVQYWKIIALPAFGALKSTAKDLEKYIKFLFSNKIDLTVKNELINPYLKWDKEEIISTPGLTIDYRHNSHFYAAAGKTLGFTSFMGYAPNEKKGIIVLTNSDSIDQLGHHLLNQKFPLQRLFETVSLSASSLEKFVGSYRGKGDLKDCLIEIVREDNHLILKLDKSAPLYLYPASQNTFFIKYFGENYMHINFIESHNQIKFTFFTTDEEKIFFYKVD